eukprot:6999600-Alexandrium_andersonii.AAC.1
MTHAAPSWREFRRAWGAGGELWEGAGNCSKLRSESQVWVGGDVRLARAETGHGRPLRSLRQGRAATGAA